MRKLALPAGETLALAGGKSTFEWMAKFQDPRDSANYLMIECRAIVSARPSLSRYIIISL